MEYAEFLEFLKKNKIRYEKPTKKGKGYTWTSSHGLPDVEYFRAEWSTGGVGGGSCWDTGETNNNYSYTSDNPPEEITELDRILELLCPNITYIQYKNVAQVIESGGYTNYEYYGNSTNYSYKQIKLPVLFDKLKERGLI